jgi:hypothetical protein
MRRRSRPHRHLCAGQRTDQRLPCDHDRFGPPPWICLRSPQWYEGLPAIDHGPTLAAWPGRSTILRVATTPPFLMTPSPFTPRASSWCALPFKKRSTGARLPLQRSQTKSDKCSPTLATLSLPRRFIATMKSPWALPTKPSSQRCRNLAICASTGFRTGCNDASSGSSTFQVFGT